MVEEYSSSLSAIVASLSLAVAASIG